MNDLIQDKKLYKLIQKQVLTLQEFQYAANHEFVASVEIQTPDKTRPALTRYLIKYQNGDFDTIYLKK